MFNDFRFCGVCNSVVEHNVTVSFGVRWVNCAPCNVEPEVNENVETKTDILYALNTLHKVIDYRKSVT
jgi:hypothetical protein